ncbi:hypothetical protein C9374_000246 [Naegleria lovaniensis]|uniref:Uncharacterized protein n=1 Tax=Naegleria lovaniensis TaxID=51637 RepID=A0AA88GTW5_NAELO|nr:uncharacterized protein C9374_000246 [Naegleria lovaniensis]KAG2388807.1 hypothetical protein C9374_000246 [Naegleria lovaniensis]
MPLFGTPKKPLQKRGFGQALEKGWSGNKPIYHIAITNEVFDDYEEYVNRAIMYKLQIWSCQYSGKDNMTYEQALECEKEQKIKHLFKFYPRYILRHICYMIHNCRRGETVKDLVYRISKFFEYNFVEGEELFCELDTTISVVLRRILLKKAKYYIEDPNFPPFPTPLYITDADQNQIEVFHQTKAQEHYYDYDPQNIGFGTQGKLYEVEVLSNNSPFENRVIVVYYSVLLRKQVSLIETQDKLTQWIMENTYYDESSDCIRLKQEFVDHFKLEPHQSKADKIPTFQKNLEEEMEDIYKFKKGLVRSVNDLKYHHVDKLGKIMTDIKEIEQSLRASSSSNFEPSHNNVSQKNHVHIGMNGTETKIIQPAVNPLLLPKEDGTILDEYITSRSKSKSDSHFPKPHYEYIITHVEAIPEALNVFNFLNVFRDSLKILPFTFDEFQHSLECKSENNPLLRSILSAMLLFLFFDKGTNKQDVNRSIYKMKKLYNQVRTKEQRIINLPSRKQVINREATVYISQAMPVILLREYWRVFMSHEMIDIPDEEETTTTTTSESNGTTEAPAEGATADQSTSHTPEDSKQETIKQNDNTDVSTINPAMQVEESKQEPHPAEQQKDSAAEVESTTASSATTSNTTNPPENTMSNHNHENNHTTTNVKEEKTESGVKQETTDSQKTVTKPPNLIASVMKFIKDDNYHNENEINFFTDLESNAKIYILSKLTEQCILSATVREYIDENIEQMRRLKRQRNIENNDDIERQKEEASKQEADESSNNNRRFTSEEVRTRKVEREKNYQVLVNQHIIRAKQLGFDRFFNRYWFFPSFTGLLFVEPCSPFRVFANNYAEDPVDTRPWGFYSSKKEIEKLISVLDPAGFREKKLLNSLLKNKEEIYKQVELRHAIVSKLSASTEASENAMKDEEATALVPPSTDATTNTSTISVTDHDTEFVENKMAVDADSTDSPSSKKRKHMDDSQSDMSEVSSSSAQPNTKKTKTEQTLSEQAKNIKVFIPSSQSFAPDAFLFYKNTLEEVIPQDSECFIVETEEEDEDE